MTWTIFPPRLEEVPFVMRTYLGGDVHDRVAPHEREAALRGHDVLDDLFRRGEHEVQVLVVCVQNAAIRASALHFDEDPLVEALLKDIEGAHREAAEAGSPS